MRSMKKHYGAKKAERVFYASRSAGTISGVDRQRSVRSYAATRRVARGY